MSKTADLLHVIEEAQLAFFESLKNSFPEIKSGDLGPMDTIAFDMACHNVVKAWLTYNKPLEKTPC